MITALCLVLAFVVGALFATGVHAVAAVERQRQLADKLQQRLDAVEGRRQ